MAQRGQLNWNNVVSVVSATILVFTQVATVAIAAGWALAGLLNLGEIGEYVLMAIFFVIALYGTWRYFRKARLGENLRQAG